MRFAALAASVLTLAATAGAARAAGPPLIHEPWTRLPCPAHPSSTIEIEGCLERAITRSDRRIDAKTATIFNLLVHQTDRAGFVAGERLWLRYRRRSCAAAASEFRGGSAEPIAFLRCEQGRNARHLADLLEMERTLRHP